MARFIAPARQGCSIVSPSVTNQPLALASLIHPLSNGALRAIPLARPSPALRSGVGAVVALEEKSSLRHGAATAHGPWLRVEGAVAAETR